MWTIVSTFFSTDLELRIAALLHDIGHLPFSHAVERTLGFNHHAITEELILGEEVSPILDKYGFSPKRIIAILNQDSPISHKTSYLSADHLDSFLRDSYMLGKSNMHPAEILKNISFNHHYVEGTMESSRSIMESIFHDHNSFLSPILLSLDAMLAYAITVYASEKDIHLEMIQSLTNNELINLLESSHTAKKILDVIMWSPQSIRVEEKEFEGCFKVDVKKVYDKTPMVDGVPLTELCSESMRMLEQIRSLQKEYYFAY